jgi:tetratricopeptide (TPR) repeat protein
LDKQNTPIDSAQDDYAAGTIVFGKFEIVEFIASGGMGRVYKARDVRLNTIIALKVLRREGNKERDLMRFQSEAKTASRLKHKNIATILDFGLFEGTPYLTMEFVEGRSLASILDSESTLPLSLFLEIFIQICEALAHAHKNGIVHRDLKPANIAVRRLQNEELVAKILDFGVAKRIDVLVESDGRLTPTGDIIGSPLYMSPEQSQGIAVTPQSDLYSLACVMWHCLTGSPPFVGETAMETIIHHQKTRPEDLSAQLPDEIPDELSELIYAMLSKSPEKRGDLESSILPSLKQMRSEIQALSVERGMIDLFDNEADTADATIALKPQDGISKTLIFGGALVALVCSVLIFVITAPGKLEHADGKKFALQTMVAMPEKLTLSVEQQRNLSRMTAVQLGKEVNFRLDGSDKHLRTLPDRKLITNISISSSGVTDKGLAYLAEAKGLIRLDASNTRLKTLEHLGQLKSVESIDLKNTDITDDSFRNFSGLNQLRILWLSGTRISDRSLVVLPPLPQLREIDLSNTGLTGSTLAELKKCKLLEVVRLKQTPVSIAGVRALMSGNPTVRLVDLKKNPNLSESEIVTLSNEYPCTSFVPYPSQLAEAEQNAKEQEEKKVFSSARKYYEDCVAMIEKQYGKNDSRLLEHLMAISRQYTYQNKRRRSVPFLQRVIAISKKYNDVDHEIRARDELAAEASERLGFLKAEPLYAANHKFSQTVLAGRPIELDSRCNNLAATYFAVKEFQKAAKLFQESVDLRRGSYGPHSPPQAISNVKLADCYRELRNYSLATRTYNEAVNDLLVSTALRDQQARALVIAYAGLANIEIRNGNLPKAQELNSEACEICKTHSLLGVYVPVLEQRLQILRADKRPQAEIDLVSQTLEATQAAVRKRLEANGTAR